MSQITAEMIEEGRSGSLAASAQRKRNAQKMRAARERLTSSGTGQRTFDLELLRLFGQNQRTVIVIQAVMVCASAFVLSCWLSWILVVPWLAGALTGLGCALLLVRRFEQADLPTIVIERWRNRFVLSQFAQSTVWALFAGLFARSAIPVVDVGIPLLLLSVSATVALLCASLPWAFYAGALPTSCALLGLILYDFKANGTYEAVIAIAAQVFCFIVARRLYTVELAVLAVKAERDTSIVELEQARLNSDEARRRAEEANLAKSRFLATMSHELRTPLNAILGFSEVMKGELFGPHSVPVYKEYSNDVHSSGQHLLMLINEILDLSRVEAGRYDLHEEPVSLGGIVEECRHLMTLRANKREIRLQEAVERNLPRIWADERAIRQVVLNLLSNAIKFTPQGGSVTIKVGWTVDRGQYVSIKDTGPGIPEAEIPIVMSSFGRGTLAQKNADEGSGLGLPIVKGLVEMHGGSFTLKSKVREGTEVIVVLPPERVIDAMPQMDAGAQSGGSRRRHPFSSAA
ncbi:sensor histidine kinase [Lichenifustis flavocetrariae]|uniref:histidine kinase n=1 Tax=Lichenifustis flavocetrariae TaxID=2949735 RepID=A0AA42CIV6_9HYPH|nr:ATP-binding protein [Lichenifustis flavocetrariae]MCW6508794.1 ATP-binding protein [Lichenifustis flavocetrariae]